MKYIVFHKIYQCLVTREQTRKLQLSRVLSSFFCLRGSPTFHFASYRIILVSPMCLADVNRVRNRKLLGKKLLAMDYTIQGWFLAGTGLRDCGENGFAAGNVPEERCSPNVGRGRVIVGIFTSREAVRRVVRVCLLRKYWPFFSRCSLGSSLEGERQEPVYIAGYRRKSSLFTSFSAFSSVPLRDKISSYEFYHYRCSVKNWIIERGNCKHFLRNVGRSSSDALKFNEE